MHDKKVDKVYTDQGNFVAAGMFDYLFGLSKSESLCTEQSEKD